MADIRIALNKLDTTSKELGFALLEFYETMKELENDSERGGKQATKIVMTMSDIKEIFKNQFL